MKTKIIIGFFLSLISLLSLSAFAQEISFAYGSGDHFGKGCLVPLDVYADAQGQPIAATDLVMEASMTYVDFVPGAAFPYTFPPVVRSNGLIHIVAFSADPSQLLTGKAKIGTLYFKDTSTNADGSVKFYQLETGNTTDTNLSYGGKDYLKNTTNAYVVLDQTPCEHAAAISGGLAGIDPMTLINQTTLRIAEDGKAYRIHYFMTHYLWLCIVSFLLVILVVLMIIYRKRVRQFISQHYAGKIAG